MALVIVAGACAAPPPPPANRSGSPRSPDPVIILDGWQLDCRRAGLAAWKTWTAEATRRRSAAGEITFFAYDSCQPNSVASAAFGRFVEDTLARTGAPRVDVIAHSMGSLIVRSCIRFGRCDGRIDQFLSLAGPNHGTVWAGLCGLAFWSQSTCDMNPDGPFLAGLNAGDETWGDTEYVTMISWCDLTVVPFTSAALDGAVNIVSDRCVSHTDWLKDAQAADWTFDWFGGEPVRPQPPAPAAR